MPPYEVGCYLIVPAAGAFPHRPGAGLSAPVWPIPAWPFGRRGGCLLGRCARV